MQHGQCVGWVLGFSQILMLRHGVQRDGVGRRGLPTSGGAGEWTSSRIKGTRELPCSSHPAGGGRNVHLPRSRSTSVAKWAHVGIAMPRLQAGDTGGKWRPSHRRGVLGFWSSPIRPSPFLTQLVLFFMMIKIYNINSAISAPLTFITKVRSVRYILQVGAAASELSILQNVNSYP